MTREERLRIAHELMPAVAALQLVRQELATGPDAELIPLLDGAIAKVRAAVEEISVE